MPIQKETAIEGVDQMVRDLKALCFAFLAIFAMSAIAAGSAQGEIGAGPSAFTAEEYPAFVGGEQEGTMGVFSRGSRTVTCEDATFFWTITAATTEVIVHPTYANCHASIFGTKFDATITYPQGCNYILHTTTDVASGTDTFTALWDLTCMPSGDVQIDIYKAGTPTTAAAHENTNNFLCGYTLQNQSYFKTIKLTNKEADEMTPKDWVTADINLEGIISKRVDGTSNIVCGGENDFAGTMTGTMTLKGTNAAQEPNGITVTTEAQE
jgi:hypothetical protein